MAAQHVINVDLAKVKDSKGNLIRILAWGDEVEVMKVASDHIEVAITKFVDEKDGSVVPIRDDGIITMPKKGGVKPSDIIIPKRDSRILKIDFVDVQQGDGSVIETPKGKVVLIDGGDNQLFARYLANRFRGTSDKNPRKVDCILVTHGDADHFLGLTEIHKSESDARLPRHKRLFIYPLRVYHNGLVKRPSKKRGRRLKETQLLGGTKKVKDKLTGKEVTLITELETNLLKVSDDEMNEPFLRWKEALKRYRKHGPIEFQRLTKGDDDAFAFLADEGLKIQVLGPILTKQNGIEGLLFLGNPPKGPRIGQESLGTEGARFKGFSASHTINGHSVILKLNYGSFNFLFAGDLNDQAERILTSAHNRGELNLQSEVFKVPHHGSADFSGAFIQAVSPVLSIVSSGDETTRKEYIHPRATLMGALGKYGRLEEPLIFVTELAAFFSIEGFIDPNYHQLTTEGNAAIRQHQRVVDPKKRGRFFALSRTAFGIIMVRTDGNRLLVYTNSGQTKLKEAYAFAMNRLGKPEPVEVRQA